MLFTFLFDGNSLAVPAPSAEKVTTPHNFHSRSIERVILYALLVNHQHIQQRDARRLTSSLQTESSYGHSYLMLRAVKRAMVAAAKEVRTAVGPRGYAKIRYLYEELVRRVEGEAAGQEKYIRLILEEFESGYISQVYVELQNSNCYVKSSKSSQPCSPLARGDAAQEADFSFSFEHFGAVLERLSIRLTIVDSWESREMGQSDPALSMVVRQLRDGSFKLREIVTLSDQSQ